jgi:hypothetical protein
MEQKVKFYSQGFLRGKALGVVKLEECTCCSIVRHGLLNVYTGSDPNSAVVRESLQSWI